MRLRSRQKGIGWFGLLFVLGVLGLFAVVGVKCLPIYLNQMKLAATLNSQPDGRMGVLFHIKGRHDPPQRKQIKLGVMDLIRQRFEKTCDRLGYAREREPLNTGLFRPASLQGQQSLF